MKARMARWGALAAMLALGACATGGSEGYTRERDFSWEETGGGVQIWRYVGNATDVRIPPQIR
ncbi:MAG: hypothetical protein FWE09_02015, partial [Treponema sp.]|nr:hypothetical protein [Treponema sp.]